MRSEPAEDDVPLEDPLRPETLYGQIQSGSPVTILDIREPSEYEKWHISGPSVQSGNVPAYDFIDDPNEAVLKRVPDGEPLTVVCAQGKSSALIAGWLSGQGYSARNLEGGMEGWSRVYVANEVTAYDGPGTLLQYLRPSSGCLGYLLYHDGEAAVFDPLQAFADRYLADATDREVQLRYAFDTHIHADHLSGVRALQERGVEGVLPAPALDRGATYASAVTAIEDGDQVTVGSATVEAVHTPGHTTGMTSYLIQDSVLLTGDGLFTESVARPDLEDGADGAPDAARTLYSTLQERILSLPDGVVIAPGHTSETGAAGPDGTITARLGDLRDRMSVLGMDESAFVDRVLSNMPPRPANYERIIATNLGQEAVTATEAFELELGPNNCATSADALD